MEAAPCKHGRVAFITTPKFRESSPEVVEDFVYTHLFEICSPFFVVSTGRTGKLLREILERQPDEAAQKKIAMSMNLSDFAEYDLDRWRQTINESLEIARDGVQGMIYVTYELVEGRMDAIIHFTDWEDKSAKPDSAVLSREANVHDVPIATDPHTALTFIATWKKHWATGSQIFVHRDQPKAPPLRGLTTKDRVLAIVAHDNMKLETCRFAVENASHIFQNYDYILSTGNTGLWLKRFMEAAGWGSSEVAKIRCCNSGPMGGDIQIAQAVVLGICRKVVFLQDPTVSHPHDADIKLFEQAIVARDVHVELATNVQSARFLIVA